MTVAGQQWIRLDVAYFSNPKVLRAGPEAALLHLASVCYLGAHELDDGIVPAEFVKGYAAVLGLKRPSSVVERLVKNGLWHRADDGGFIVHDYDKMNGRDSEAAASRHRQRERAARRRRNQQGQFE